MRDLSPCCPEREFPTGWLPMRGQKVSPDWIDYNGHMNVAYYTMAFDKAFDDLLDNWLGVGEGFVRRSRLGPMVLQSQICYLGELMEGEDFHVEVQLLDHDEKRMHVFGAMISEKTGERAATYESMNLCVDLEARRAAAYPDWAQERLAKWSAAQAGLPRPDEAGRPIGIRRKS